MSRKGDKTKHNIAAAARKLFAEKGFSRVTMQDVCNASGMSRGGVYRHFPSTAEIIVFIINEEHEKNLASLKLAIKTKVPAKKIFDKFIRYRINQVIDRENSIDNAITEFVNNNPEMSEFMSENVEKSVKIVADIIRMCRNENAFDCDDPEGMSRHVLWTIEGMSKHNALIPISQAEIEQQIRIIYRILQSQ